MGRPDKYVSRSDLGWGPSPADYANPTRGLVIHYDSSNLGLASKPHSSCVQYWKSTRSFHTGPSRGWADIGYSFFACPHGYILEGRGIRKVQAAQPGGNSTYYSCTLSGGPSENPTAAQIDAVRRLRKWLMADYGVSGTVKGHRDFISTSCPGDKAYALVKNGTFSKEPGASTGGMEDDMVGLSKGDQGERVKYLQDILMKAGFDLPKYGADGHYGAETEAAVLAARKSQGSEQNFGDRITGWAAAQIMMAFVKARS